MTKSVTEVCDQCGCLKTHTCTPSQTAIVAQEDESASPVRTCECCGRKVEGDFTDWVVVPEAGVDLCPACAIPLLAAERDRLREFAERVVEVYEPGAENNPGCHTYWMHRAALEALGRG